jgi:hypothetical protein
VLQSARGGLGALRPSLCLLFLSLMILGYTCVFESLYGNLEFRISSSGLPGAFYRATRGFFHTAQCQQKSLRSRTNRDDLSYSDCLNRGCHTDSSRRERAERYTELTNFARANAAAAASPPVRTVCTAPFQGEIPVNLPFVYPKRASATSVMPTEYQSPVATLEESR